MPSFRKAVSRLLKAVTFFKASSGHPSGAGESPNLFIFSLYFTDKGTSAVGTPKSFAPQELLIRITQHSNAVDYIGKIHVTEILYCKGKGLPNYEFLVFKVKATDQKLSNYIKINRCPQPKVKAEHPNPEIGLSQEDGQTPLFTGNSDSGILFQSSSPIKHTSLSTGNQEMRDMIHISSSQGIKLFVNSRIKIAARIKVLTGPPGQRPTLEQLIVLAKFVSSYQPQYNVFNAQWYAYTVWMLLLTTLSNTVIFNGKLSRVIGKTRLFPLVALHKQDIQSEGKNGGATKVTKIQQHAELAAKYLDAWVAFEQDILTMQEKYGAKARDMKIKEERRRIQEEWQEERRQIEEERRAEAAKTQQQIKEERWRIEERHEEIQRLQKIVAELQAKSTAT